MVSGPADHENCVGRVVRRRPRTPHRNHWAHVRLAAGRYALDLHITASQRHDLAVELTCCSTALRAPSSGLTAATKSGRPSINVARSMTRPRQYLPKAESSGAASPTGFIPLERARTAAEDVISRVAPHIAGPNHFSAQFFQHINGLSPTSQFSPSRGAGGKAPTRGARMPTVPSISVGWAVEEAWASSARCREVTWFVRAIAGVASMAAAITAADRILSIVIFSIAYGRVTTTKGDRV
jgi:hypothetical protein